MRSTFRPSSLFRQLLAAAGLAACALSAQAGLVNAGFETGSLTGWTTNGAVVTNNQAHTGTYSVAAFGGEFVRQDFAAIAVADITELSFWVRRLQGGNLDYVQFFYSDSTLSDYMFNTLGSGDPDWTFADLTSHLTAGKLLTGFLVYGTSAGPAYLDDFTLSTSRQGNTVPEPAALLLSGVAAAAAAAAMRRRRAISR